MYLDIHRKKMMRDEVPPKVLFLGVFADLCWIRSWQILSEKKASSVQER